MPRRRRFAILGAVTAFIGLALIAQLDDELSALFPRVFSPVVAADGDESILPTDAAREARDRVTSVVSVARQRVGRGAVRAPEVTEPSPGIVRSPPN